jgi:hypothetical protein
MANLARHLPLTGDLIAHLRAKFETLRMRSPSVWILSSSFPASSPVSPASGEFEAMRVLKWSANQ